MTTQTAEQPNNGEDVILQQFDNNILTITLNRPAARNAVNAAVHSALGRALEQADADPEVRCIIITGAGDRSFCAGADLVALSRGEKIIPQDPVEAAWGFAGFVSNPISKPIITAVNGFALGGGTELVLASDLCVAVDTAAFGLPEVKRGIIAAAGGAFRLVQQMPHKRAMEILLTGDPVSATEALGLGLINKVVARGELMSEARKLAERIICNAPLSVQASKRIAVGIDDGEITGDKTDWARNLREAQAIMSSSDAHEGPRAFAEKRAPNWKAS